jgi:hypothetical protein
MEIDVVLGLEVHTSQYVQRSHPPRQKVMLALGLIYNHLTELPRHSTVLQLDIFSYGFATFETFQIPLKPGSSQRFETGDL